VNDGKTFSAPLRITASSFVPPVLNPNQDTAVRTCYWGDFGSIIPTASGFSMSWIDDRDTTGSAVDPNVYFARVPAFTALSFTVKQTSSKITVTGAVAPTDATGSVGVTLYKKVGKKFVKAGTKSAPLVEGTGAFAASLPHPSAASCKVSATYPGDAGHQPSARTLTFAC
jgi:hypothetical protein